MVKRQSGFTLIEVLVTVVLFMLVMLLLFRGVTAVTTTVSLGQRQSSLHRNLKTVERVMRNDVEGLLVHPNWPVFVGDLAATPPALALAFLKYRTGSEGDTETEWVQYWIEAHPEEARLRQLVRYAEPADNRAGYNGDWWTQITPDQMQEEVLVDDLIQIQCQVWTRGGQVPVLSTVTQQVEAVDVNLFLTDPPIPLVLTPVTNQLQRMWQEKGGWAHFRMRPQIQPGPVWEVLP
jgi:prepilin-type N-terminal cleavage/methylation domain-containing protein